MEAILEVLFAIITGVPGRERLKKMKPIGIAYGVLAVSFVAWLAFDKYLI